MSSFQELVESNAIHEAIDKITSELFLNCNYKKTLEYLEIIIPYIESHSDKLNLENELGQCKFYLGNCQYILGNSEIATKILMDSVSISKDNNDFWTMIGGYSKLIEIYYLQENKEKINDIISDINRLSDRYKDDIKKDVELQSYTKYVVSMSKALQHKLSKRTKEKVKSEEILRNLLEQQNLSFRRTNILFHLLELLLLEYEMFEDQDILDEIINYLSLIEDTIDVIPDEICYYKKYHIFYYIIRGKIELIEGKFQNAKVQYEEALKIIDKFGFYELKETVEREIKQMEEEFKELQELINDNKEFGEIIRRSSIMKYVEKANSIAFEFK